MSKLLKNILIAITPLIISIIFIDRMPQLITIITLGTAGIYLILRKTDKDMRAKIVFLFLTAFVLHIFLSMYMYSQTVDTKFYGFSYKGDDYSYGDFGKIVGDFWRRGIFSSLIDLRFYSIIGQPGAVPLQYYQVYNAFVFYLFGACAGQILLIINCFFYSIIIVPVYFLCRELKIKNEIVIFIVCLFLFWPSTFYWSLFNLKEPIILLALMSFLGSAMQFQKMPYLKNVFPSLVFLFLLYFFKEAQMTYVIPFALLYFIFLLRWKYKGITMLAISLIFILRQILGEPITFKIYHLILNAPMAFSNIRSTAYFMNTSYFWHISTDTYPRTILYFPLGVLATLFLPFLLRPFSIVHIAANVESMLWWCLMPFLLGGIWISIREEFKKTAVMLFVFLAWLGMLALSQANMGTLIRQKAILYYIGFIFVGLGIDRALKNR